MAFCEISGCMIAAFMTIVLYYVKYGYEDELQELLVFLKMVPVECYTNDDCVGSFVCNNDGRCSCTTKDFEYLYDHGQLLSDRPWRCDITEKLHRELPIGSTILLCWSSLVFCIGTYLKEKQK